MALRSVMLIFVAAAVSVAVAPAQQQIEQSEVEKCIAQENDCGNDLDRIHIIKLKRVDLTHGQTPRRLLSP